LIYEVIDFLNSKEVVALSTELLKYVQ